MLVSNGAAAARGRFRSGKHLQVELFLVEDCDLALGGTHEQLAGHGDEDAVVAVGVIDEGVAQRMPQDRIGNDRRSLQLSHPQLIAARFGRIGETDTIAHFTHCLAGRFSSYRRTVMLRKPIARSSS